jgi:hypothetical protein
MGGVLYGNWGALSVYGSPGRVLFWSRKRAVCFLVDCVSPTKKSKETPPSARSRRKDRSDAVYLHGNSRFPHL